ncbi:hypothetical protein ABUH48_14975, partial [Enterococcus faecium]
KAIVPKPLISNSLGSNSLVAETIRMKFGQKVPAYRQENYWKQSKRPIEQYLTNKCTSRYT